MEEDQVKESLISIDINNWNRVKILEVKYYAIRAWYWTSID